MLTPSLLHNDDWVHIYISTVHRHSWRHLWRLYTMLPLHHTPSCCTRRGHIHVQHRMFFRSKIHVLQAIFFSKIFGNQPAMKLPRLIALTVTMPNSYLPLLSYLLTINSFTGNALICSSSIDFSQCKIGMLSYITSNKGQYALKGLSLVSNILQDNLSFSTVVFLQFT